MQKGDTSQALAFIEYKADASDPSQPKWQTLWCCFNVLQFLPNFYAFTSSSRDSGAGAALTWHSHQVSNADDQGEGFSTVLSAVDADFRDSLVPIVEFLPDDVAVGSELVSEEGEVLADAELASEGGNWCFLAPWQIASKAVFEKQRWSVLHDMTELKAFLDQ